MTKILYTLLLLTNFIYPELLKPENNTELNYTHVLFEWEQVYQAESYNFQLSTDQTFNNIIVDTIDQTTLYIHKTDIDWNSEYFWRVRPQFSGESFGDWIGTNSFSTGLSISNAYSINYNDNDYSDGVTIFSSFFNFTGLTHPCSQAVSLIYFSMDPIVTVPCPDCSMTQIPSQSLS